MSEFIKEYLVQQYITIGSPTPSLGSVAVSGSDTVSQDPLGTVLSGLVDLKTNSDLTNRKLYAYVFARVASDALSFFELRVVLSLEGRVRLNLPLTFGYKTSGATNGYRTSAFTWSDTATPILLPESIFVKTQSVFGQPQNPPPDETGAIYLHPFPVNFAVSNIRIDVVRWTNINTNNVRVLLATKAD